MTIVISDNFRYIWVSLCTIYPTGAEHGCVSNWKSHWFDGIDSYLIVNVGAVSFTTCCRSSLAFSMQVFPRKKRATTGERKICSTKMDVDLKFSCFSFFNFECHCTHLTFLQQECILKSKLYFFSKPKLSNYWLSHSLSSRVPKC